MCINIIHGVVYEPNSVVSMKINLLLLMELLCCQVLASRSLPQMCCGLILLTSQASWKMQPEEWDFCLGQISHRRATTLHCTIISRTQLPPPLQADIIRDPIVPLLPPGNLQVALNLTYLVFRLYVLCQKVLAIAAPRLCQQFGQPMLTGDQRACSGISGSEQAKADHQVA